MIVNAPLVVGYKGEIGSFILNGLLKTMPKASNIWCVDINDSPDEVAERIKRSDFIFLCVPLDKTIEWVNVWKRLLKDKVIVEQCSLKAKQSCMIAVR
jgi:prephenate dehydrogenase